MYNANTVKIGGFWILGGVFFCLGCAEGGSITAAGQPAPGGGEGGNAQAGAGGVADAGTSGSGMPGGHGGGASGSGGDAGSAGTAGSGGSAGSAGTTGSGGSGDPCEGVVCDVAPDSVCDNADQLRVYNVPGGCADGDCAHSSWLTNCPNGCSDGACLGDPCLGVTCTNPDGATCVDSTHLRVHSSPGACSEGECNYPYDDAFCEFGCENDKCLGNPCVGVNCDTPPLANSCSDTSTLLVYERPGTCLDGECDFKTHTEDCSFGCSGGACEGDPCVGVTCASPDADSCSSPTALREHADTGTCNASGGCDYAEWDTDCAHGCVGGACRECTSGTLCETGKWCVADKCQDCNSDARCGDTCTDCTAAGRTCDGSGKCIECVIDSHCEGGEWCDSGTCTDCNTAQHCGASCQTCAGQTPSCNGTSCVCSANSCASNKECTSGTCSVCASDSACGASCTACGGSTPHCLDEGSSSRCVQCETINDCSGTDACTNNQCVPTGSCKNVQACSGLSSGDCAAAGCSSSSSCEGGFAHSCRWWGWSRSDCSRAGCSWIYDETWGWECGQEWYESSPRCSDYGSSDCDWAGCSWTTTCGGSPPTCSSSGDKSSCNARTGCVWQ